MDNKAIKVEEEEEMIGDIEGENEEKEVREEKGEKGDKEEKEEKEETDSKEGIIETMKIEKKRNMLTKKQVKSLKIRKSMSKEKCKRMNVKLF